MNNNIKYICQVFTGGWNNQLYSKENICKRLDDICKMISIEKLIIGWNIDKELYKHVIRHMHNKGVEVYLWLPILSEIGLLGGVDNVVSISGKASEGYKLQEGESFEFYCPSSNKNFELLKRIYTENFSECNFDGVFIDKIRSQSYVGGIESVVACMCDECKNEYEAAWIDIKELRKEIIDKKERLFDIERIDPLEGVIYKNEQLQNFFDLKKCIYTKRISEITTWFKEQVLEVGMDVFAPCIANVVGQDIVILLELCDFIKPMMYRRTEAPAGIGFEYRHLAKFTNNPLYKEFMTERVLSSDFMCTQLEAMTSIHKEKVYAGIEVNYREDIARTDASYVKESVELAKRSNCQGVVLAWDVMLAPDEHISCLMDS